jgi:hypothetical protein
MAAADDARERWLEDGSPDYHVLPEPVSLDDTIAMHPAEPAEPPSGWSAGPADLGGGGGGSGDDGD